MSAPNQHNTQSGEVQFALMQHQLAQANAALADMREQLARLVPMEVRFDALMKAVEDLTRTLKDQDKRINTLESDRKPLDAVSKIVGAFVIALCGAALTVVWEKATSTPHARTDPPVQTQTTQQPK